MARYIFITGGVVSSLGKGLASAALGALLQARGYSVRLRKLDPYLNVDPGTMSPFEHGEVFVTDDGAETDLDLGHYERFTGVAARRTDFGLVGADLFQRAGEGAPRRLPRQDHPGDPARHQRDQGFPTGRRRRGRLHAVRDRRHGRRHRGAAVLRGDPPVRPGAAAAQLHLRAPDAAALHGGVGRAEDQADAAFGQGAALDRHRAGRAGLPLADADPGEGAREAGALLQRAARGGDRGAGPALDLRGAARLSQGGARPGGARRLRDRAGAAAEPDEVGGRGRPDHEPRGRGAGRGRRQVHPARGRLQVDRRGADPRRHRQPGQGAGRVWIDSEQLRGRREHPAAARAASTRSWCPAASASAAPRG